MFIIENEKFTKLQEIERATETEKQRKNIKFKLLDPIANLLGRTYRNAKKLAAVIDEIVYKATDRGYSFNGRETLAKKLGISLPTVDRAIKAIKDTGEVIVAYRENPNSNGYKTPIFIFKNHANFKEIIKLINYENIEHDIVDDKVKDAETPTGASDSEAKTFATYNIPKNKKDIYNMASAQGIDKIKEYITYKVQDAQERNPYGIKYLSSYVDKVVNKLISRAIYLENAKYKKRLKVKRQPAPVSIPFYNWLES